MRVAPATGSTAVTCCSGARRIGTMRARIASAISSGVRAPMITAYVGDVPPAIAKPLIATYKKQYSRTYVAYAGGTTDTPGTYIRIDGPQAWIELAVQSTDKGASHYHSVYRDKKHDYGA